MACCDVNAASDQVNHLFLVFFSVFNVPIFKRGSVQRRLSLPDQCK